MSKINRTSHSNIELYKALYNEAHSGAYISYIRGTRCKTEDDFFREISASFQFPWYFGGNWSALDECLCDLEWLNFNRIFVAVDNFTQMFEGSVLLQNLVIKYLTIASKYWGSLDIDFEILLNN